MGRAPTAAGHGDLVGGLDQAAPEVLDLDARQLVGQAAQREQQHDLARGVEHRGAHGADLVGAPGLDVGRVEALGPADLAHELVEQRPQPGGAGVGLDLAVAAADLGQHLVDAGVDRARELDRVAPLAARRRAAPRRSGAGPRAGRRQSSHRSTAASSDHAAIDAPSGARTGTWSPIWRPEPRRSGTRSTMVVTSSPAASTTPSHGCSCWRATSAARASSWVSAAPAAARPRATKAGPRR